MNTWSRVATALICLLAAGTPAPAQNATRPITVIVPASPGGVTDMLGRILAKNFAADWGQEVVVENKPGANNQIAAEYVAHQPPDGTTLFIGPETTFIVNPTLYGHLNYDPVKDFTPISGLVTINHALILNPSVPAANVAELIALGKKKPGALNYGTFGVGSSGHLNMEMFKTMAGVDFVPVHYKGATPALTDVVAGHIQMMFISVGSAVPQWKAGAVKFIAVGAEKRLALLPDIPTVSESGLPGYVAVSWFGLFGPAGMAPSQVAKINAEVQKVFADENFKKTFLEAQYFESIAGSPEALAERIRVEEPKWRKVISAAHITVQ
jgi:tripartite-type tricarboxylate transporter receptor subunit TctC